MEVFSFFPWSWHPAQEASPPACAQIGRARTSEARRFSPKITGKRPGGPGAASDTVCEDREYPFLPAGASQLALDSTDGYENGDPLVSSQLRYMYTPNSPSA